MQKLFSYRKLICSIVLVSLYWLCMPQLPAQAAIVTTEDSINRYSKADFDRSRIKAFVSRKDVIAQFQFYGFSSVEAVSLVDSLTDQEVALIIGKIDKLPAGGDAGSAMVASFEAGIGKMIANMTSTITLYALYALIAAAIIAVILLIIAYALDEGPNKPTYKKF